MLRTFSPASSVRTSLLVLLTATLFACGGGCGGGNNGNTPLPKTTNPNLPTAGHIVFENSSSLGVLDLATLQARTTKPPSTNDDPGLGVSRNGVIADVNNYSGGDKWNVDIRSLDLSIRSSYPVGPSALLSFPSSAAALGADGSLIAFSVNEMTSDTDDTRVDRICILNLVTNTGIKIIIGFEEPVFFGRRPFKLALACVIA